MMMDILGSERRLAVLRTASQPRLVLSSRSQTDDKFESLIYLEGSKADKTEKTV